MKKTGYLFPMFTNMSSKKCAVKMIYNLFIFVVLTCLCGCSGPSEEKQIRDTVKIFMSKTGDLGEFEREMKILYKDPKLAVGLLIQELHVINNKKFDDSAIDAPRINPDTNHVIECIRGLRHLTGKNFFAPTKEMIKDEVRRAHLYLDDETEKVMPFFMTRMSTYMVFIAPKDAQQAIIDQWREWYKKEGQNYDYEKNRMPISDPVKFVR